MAHLSHFHMSSRAATLLRLLILLVRKCTASGWRRLIRRTGPRGLLLAQLSQECVVLRSLFALRQNATQQR